MEVIKKNSYYIKSFIGILIMLTFKYLPVIEPITPLGMNILGIFIGIIYCWTFVDSIWPSILSVVLLGMSGYDNMWNTVTQAFGNPVLIQMFFMMIFIGLVQEEKVSEYIARWFITRKIINKRPWVFTFMYLLGAFIVAGLASTIPAVLLFWPIAYSIFKELNYKAGDKYVTLLLISVTLMVAMGGATFPYKEGAMILLGNYFNLTGISVGFAQYTIVMLLLSLTILISLILFMKFILKPDVTNLKDIDVELLKKNSLPPMNKKQKYIFISLIIFILLMFIPPLLPKTLAIKQTLDIISPLGITLLIPTILYIMKIDNQPILDFKKITTKYTSWEAYFLVVSALIIGSALTSKETGVNLFLKENLAPLFLGKSILSACILLIFLGFLLTNLCNSLVMGMLLMPIAISVAEPFGISSILFVMLVIYSVLAFPIITPAASPYAAMAHANSEWLNPKDIYKYTPGICIIIFLNILFIGIPLIKLLLN